jgi:hypothetical protein
MFKEMSESPAFPDSHAVNILTIECTDNHKGHAYGCQ